MDKELSLFSSIFWMKNLNDVGLDDLEEILNEKVKKDLNDFEMSILQAKARELKENGTKWILRA